MKKSGINHLIKSHTKLEGRKWERKCQYQLPLRHALTNIKYSVSFTTLRMFYYKGKNIKKLTGESQFTVEAVHSMVYFSTYK